MKNFIIFVLVIALAASAYYCIFSPSIKDLEAEGLDHFQIALALPKVLIQGEAVHADAKIYVARNTEQYIALMSAEGFKKIEYAGMDNVFEKGGERYIFWSAPYSDYFMVFTYPELYLLNV